MHPLGNIAQVEPLMAADCAVCRRDEPGKAFQQTYPHHCDRDKVRIENDQVRYCPDNGQSGHGLQQGFIIIARKPAISSVVMLAVNM